MILVDRHRRSRLEPVPLDLLSDRARQWQLTQDREIQLSHCPHPDRPVAMINQVVTGKRVEEHDQILPIQGQPGYDLGKQRWLERELATPVRMRAHRPFMDSSQRQRK